MELEFEKYCVIDGSPKTVLPYPRHRPKVEKRKPRSKPKLGNHQFTTNEDFTELNLDRYRSASCKDNPSKKISIDSNEGLKRGSVYQTSKEVRRMKKTGYFEGRQKIELPRGSATALSLGILDSLCSSNEDSSLVEQNRSISGERESIVEREPTFTLHKSLSAKLAMPHSPTQSESSSSKPTNPKTRFSPLRKMFDPFVKSKSPRSPLGSVVGTDKVSVSDRTGISRSKTLRKSLLHDFSNASRAKEFNTRFDKKDSFFKPLEPRSPAHLRGFLKLENKQSGLVFEFSVKFLEVNFVAKTWKVGQVYTFHGVENKRKCNKESSLLGEMKFCCYLCTELNDAGDFGNSMVNEFVLFDKNIASQGTCDSEEFANDLGLHVVQEIAAIVIQVPFDKTESLKCKRGDFDLSRVEPRKKEGSCWLSPAKVNVVTSCGNHSFPAKSGGPSPLLDRWRLGGGCDCGGWDTGCPLIVFCNSNAQECPLVKNQNPLELFVQGKMEKTPALTIMETEEGHYIVDFHAQFSALQAFAVCVALLHGTEPSIALINEEREKQMFRCDSLRLFIGEEDKYLIEAVTEEEKMKPNNKTEETPQSFVLNPPFSPMSRV